MLFLLAKISVIIIFLSYMLCSLLIAPFVYSLIPKFIYLLWRNVFQIAIYYFHFFFGIMLRSDYIPKIIKIDQVLHPLFLFNSILYYIIFPKKVYIYQHGSGNSQVQRMPLLILFLIPVLIHILFCIFLRQLILFQHK